MTNSIIANSKKCVMCGSQVWLEKHHVFGGANRKKSEKYGLWVYLCHYCHNEPPDGVHHNRKNAEKLKAIGQYAFQREHPELDFIKLFGKNYL